MVPLPYGDRQSHSGIPGANNGGKITKFGIIHQNSIGGLRRQNSIERLGSDRDRIRNAGADIMNL